MKIIILILSAFIYATTINIPGDYPAMQEGIDIAVDGDTVLVGSGEYQETVGINKQVFLVSQNGPNETSRSIKNVTSEA